MNNSDVPAMPSSNPPSPGIVAQCKGLGIPVPKLQIHQGLTKREHFAAMAMQGIISSGNLRGKQEGLSEGVSRVAIEYADALLAELEK